jgi:hypothetical protein
MARVKHVSLGDYLGATITDGATERLHKDALRISGIVRSAIGDIAHEGEDFIRRNFMQGQAIRKLSGETADSVRAYFAREDHSWYIRYGVRVKGHLNYIARWAGTKHEFLKPGFDAFIATKNLENEISRKVEAEL